MPAQWCPCIDGQPEFCLIHNQLPQLPMIRATPDRPWWRRWLLAVLRKFGLGDQ